MAKGGEMKLKLNKNISVFQQSLSREIPDFFNKHDIQNIAKTVENILYSPKLRLGKKKFLYINDKSQNWELFWKIKNEMVINYLYHIRDSKKYNQQDLYFFITALKNFLNSLNCQIPGRYERTAPSWLKILDSYYVKKTAYFENFNTNLELLAEELHSSQTYEINWSEFTKALWQNLQYVKDNPLLTGVFLLSFKGLLSQAQTINNLPENPVAYYPFNGNANDASGHGNNAIIFGARLTEDRFGQSNNAFYFDGNNAYIKGSANHFPTAERSIALWFKPDIYNYGKDRDRGGPLFGYGGDGKCGTSMFLDINNLCDTSPNSYEIQTQCNLDKASYVAKDMYGSPSSWNHLAMTTGYSEGTKLYLNGVLVTQRQDLFISHTYAEGKEFGIGTMPSISGAIPGLDPSTNSCVKSFKGSLDDVLIYDRSLTAQDIQKIYEDKPPQPEPYNVHNKVELSYLQVAEIAAASTAVFSGLAAGAAVLFFKRKKESRCCGLAIETAEKKEVEELDTVNNDLLTQKNPKKKVNNVPLTQKNPNEEEKLLSDEHSSNNYSKK